ncbi:MAG: outer membrane lipoprotein-sorting protein [Acidobacteriota bacterium]|nr:outer membrane lipoprotein-sorting protein [Acidobacteriota bacterium]
MLPAFLVLCASVTVADPQPFHGENVVRGVDQAELFRDTNLSGYSVTEHYVVHNSRFEAAASMTVEANYLPVSGKSYSVVSRSGSSILQTRVLDRLLAEEAEMSRGATRQRALVTSANYKMRLIGEEAINGRDCKVLELVPRLKDTHLLKGRAWVDAKDYSLVRIEGKPAASPSIFAGHPTITRDYEQIEGFSLATRSHAVCDSFLLGQTELTIEYRNYKVRVAPRAAQRRQNHPISLPAVSTRGNLRG